MEKKRIAVIFEGNDEDRKGMFNAAVQRTVHLKKLLGYAPDVFMIQTYEPLPVRALDHTPKRMRKPSFEVSGLTVTNIWQRFSVLDYCLDRFLHLRKIRQARFLKSRAERFAGYDFICAHSFRSGLLAMAAHERFGTPFSVTWHGSDIHRFPFANRFCFKDTGEIMQAASRNFFVSRNLLELSEKIAATPNKTVLYNGVDKSVFHPYDVVRRREAQEKYSVDPSAENVAYVGNFFSIKNVLCLPEVFSRMRKLCSSRIAFHFVGCGKMEARLREECRKWGIDARFHLNVAPDDMPDVYNCMDLIVLPSRNEGLPLVAVEAEACGTMFAGSRVGGIPEVAGEENTIPLGPDFAADFAELCVCRLKLRDIVPLHEQFDWDATARKELGIISDVLSEGQVAGRQLS